MRDGGNDKVASDVKGGLVAWPGVLAAAGRLSDDPGMVRSDGTGSGYSVRL